MTSDVRAPQASPDSSGRVASAFTQYSSTGFSIHLNLTDGARHRVAIYMLDWDTSTRSQTIAVVDASTGQVLDTQTFSGFRDGQYAVWNLKGNLILKVAPNGTSSPSQSGVFFN